MAFGKKKICSCEKKIRFSKKKKVYSGKNKNLKKKFCSHPREFRFHKKKISFWVLLRSIETPEFPLMRPTKGPLKKKLEIFHFGLAQELESPTMSEN